MLDTGSPLLGHEEKNLAVSPPLTSHNVASRSSTPGLSSLDGTPRYLYVPQEAPLSPSPPPPDMAIRPSLPLSHGHEPEQNQADPLEMPSGMVSKSGNRKRQQSSNTPQENSVPEEEKQPVASLSEISHLLRSQRYHRHRCSQVEENLQCLQIAAARTARLVHAARSVQWTLAECIKGEDKNSFANLLHAFQDACDVFPKPNTAIPTGTESVLPSDRGSAVSFFHDLSSSSRATLLDFVAKIRSNADFVADRLSSLTTKELLALLPDRFSARSTESVLGGQSRVTSRSAKPLGFVVDTQIELLSSYSYGSPLEAIVHSVCTINGTDSLESNRSTDLWASVCARLISERKDGSEKLVPAILDVWTSSKPWPGKDRLEVWILQTLQNGSFLLEQSNKQTFRARVEGRSEQTAEEEMRAETFYATTADSLLGLFGDDHGPSIIPPGALDICHAMWNSLPHSTGQQRALPYFLITRWLFSTFLLEAVTMPEAYGLLTDHYISDLARQRILREVANRVQKAGFDVAYSWKYGNSLSAATTQRVYKVMTRLQGGPIANSTSCTSSTKPQLPSNCELFLVLSAKDLMQCLRGLFPQRRPASIASDGDNLKSGLQSSASSVSGFSLFSNAKPSESFQDSIVSDMRSLHVKESSAAPENGDADDQFSISCREACMELEELTSGYPADARDLWEVLHSSADGSLLTLCDRSVQITKAADEHPRPGDVEKTADTQSKEIVACSRAIEMLLLDDTSGSVHTRENKSSGQNLELEQRHIECLFERSIQECEARADFVKAHCWFRQLQEFRSHIVASENGIVLRNVLKELESSALQSIDRSTCLTVARDAWSSRLKSAMQLRTDHLEPLVREHRLMRDKMWYVADVRTSGPYDEARSIASALRVMGKPKRQTRTRMAPPLRHWSTSKVSATNLHLKTEAQILEILSARPDHGGPNKLGDEQARLVELWMERQNVDNLCRGEERLHKLCMEVRKCVDLITATSSADHPSIQNNVLFARDDTFASEKAVQKKAVLPSMPTLNGSHTYLSLTSHARSNDALSTASRALSSVSSQDYLESRSPTLTNQSSITFWSPSTTEVDSPSSATSIGTSRTQSAINYAPRKAGASAPPTKGRSLEAFRQRATSLVLSDLTSYLFSDGSETDRAYWTGLGRELTDRYFRSLDALRTGLGSRTPRADLNTALPVPIGCFDFEGAFGKMLAKFSVMTNPSTKLACLYDIDRLLVPYVLEKTANGTLITTLRPESESGDRTPARRVKDPAETSISGFRDIFSRSSLRPTTIFRDLQYIAALLPASVLHDTPEGKAFCHAAVAISGLKQEARTIMVETADSIIAYHSNNRGHGRSSSTAQQQRDSAIFSAPSRTPSAEDVSRYSMADAGYLLQITAREGDIVAQRELATLYLTHPDLMDRIVAPFARPRDVFKDELESKWRKNQDPNRCDPTTMCVAHHWMSLSSKGGDSLAKEYLRQREEMDSF